MRTHRLSQDAQWALRHRSRHTRPYEKKALNWLLPGIVAVLLLALATVFIISCGTSTGPEPLASTWECISAPHIRIAFDSYDSQGYGYFRLVVRDETTLCRALAEDLCLMLADGHWEREGVSEPLFLPPPPHWNNFKKEGTGIRINGSDAIPMCTINPLPTDAQITILHGGMK